MHALCQPGAGPVERLADRFGVPWPFPRGREVTSARLFDATTARERGSDIIDLQDFAGHADPRTTLTYIRSRDRLSKSPSYVFKN